MHGPLRVVLAQLIPSGQHLLRRHHGGGEFLGVREALTRHGPCQSGLGLLHPQRAAVGLLRRALRRAHHLRQRGMLRPRLR